MTGKQSAEILKVSRPAAFVGFDGFVDRLMRVVRGRNGTSKSYFGTLGEFGAHVAAAAGKSADLEAVLQEERMGGNAPLMASALCSLGAQVTCAAAMGFPRLHPAFRPLEQRGVRCESCGNPGLTQAYEFGDGKLMLAELEHLEDVGWQRVKECFSIEFLAQRICSADLLALVNWGVMPRAGDLWRGLFDEVVPSVPAGKLAFFDIADPVKRSPQEIAGLFALIARFKVKFTVEIGLNENEARQVHRAFGGSGSADLEIIARDLFRWIGPDTLVVHPVNGAMAVTKDGFTRIIAPVVQNPVLTTGGGDHFNGGWCAARLAGLGPFDALPVAVASSGHYVSTGAAAEPDDIGRYLDNYLQGSGCP